MNTMAYVHEESVRCASFQPDGTRCCWSIFERFWMDRSIPTWKEALNPRSPLIVQSSTNTSLDTRRSPSVIAASDPLPVQPPPIPISLPLASSHAHAHVHVPGLFTTVPSMYLTDYASSSMIPQPSLTVHHYNGLSMAMPMFPHYQWVYQTFAPPMYTSMSRRRKCRHQEGRWICSGSDEPFLSFITLGEEYSDTCRPTQTMIFSSLLSALPQERQRISHHSGQSYLLSYYFFIS